MERLELGPGEKSVGVCQRGGNENKIRRKAPEAWSRRFTERRVRGKGAAPFDFKRALRIVLDGDVRGRGVQSEEVRKIRGQGIVDDGEVCGAVSGWQAFMFLQRIFD